MRSMLVSRPRVKEKRTIIAKNGKDDLSGIQMDQKLALALGEVYSGVKLDWYLVWVPLPLSSRQRYLP